MRKHPHGSCCFFMACRKLQRISRGRKRREYAEWSENAEKGAVRQRSVSDDWALQSVFLFEVGIIHKCWINDEKPIDYTASPCCNICIIQIRIMQYLDFAMDFMN